MNEPELTDEEDLGFKWRELITADPAVMVGKPVIRGSRLTVEHILGLLAGGWPLQVILEEWPGLTEQEVRACVAYARDAVHREWAVSSHA